MDDLTYIIFIKSMSEDLVQFSATPKVIKAKKKFKEKEV